jgi:hypothetical protein
MFFTGCRSIVAVIPDLYFEYPLTYFGNVNGCPDWIIYSTFSFFPNNFRITPKRLKHWLILEIVCYFVNSFTQMIIEIYEFLTNVVLYV